MNIISETYKSRLQALAGIITEVTDAEKTAAFAASGQRTPYNKDLMIQAIKEGREVGILFQSNNDKYKMPVAKYRIIYPVALGLTKKGNATLRAFHKMGQSEKEAIRTGKRSAEVENTWRLFNISNIKSMWMTGNFFRGPLEAYNAQGDKSMISVEVQADFNKIRKFQDDLIKNIKDKKEQEQKRKNIVQLFRDPENQASQEYEKETPKIKPVVKSKEVKNKPIVPMKKTVVQKPVIPVKEPLTPKNPIKKK